MPYYIIGDLFGGRVGPQEAPLALGDLLIVAEPLNLLKVILSNSTTDPQTYTLYLVGATPQSVGPNVVTPTTTDAQQIVPGVNVPPNDNALYQFGDEGIPMTLNDAVRHIASGAGINVTLVVSRRHR